VVAALAVVFVLGAVAMTFGARMASAETYTVREGDTLSHVAERLGVPVRQLAVANGIEDTNLLVAGAVLTVPSPLAAVTEYVVREGDTLWGISDGTGVPVSQLASANGLDDPDWVPAGRVLTVPRGGGNTASRAAAAAPSVGSSSKYTVKAGDALSDISWRTGIPVGQLASVNGISDPNFLAEGQVLTIPAAWDCPVAGASFVNDYGYVRPDGGRHVGIDLFAPKGTPVVAPVGGTVERYPNPSGGQAVQLHGRDGNRYYFAHLDRYGEGGSVSRGSVIGYVGNSGDARATSPHLHFEIHPGGGSTTTSPYPALTASC
jgi:murein DD-endopeptidase MepM/ murein hydrolase activator NlpD